MISKGKNNPLRKNIGKPITKDVSNAVFSVLESAPITKPIRMKLIEAKRRIDITLADNTKGELNNAEMKNITNNSIAHIKMK